MTVINKKYFDEAYFCRILSLVADNRLDEALCEFKKYLIQYPNDFLRLCVLILYFILESFAAFFNFFLYSSVCHFTTSS